MLVHVVPPLSEEAERKLHDGHTGCWTCRSWTVRVDLPASLVTGTQADTLEGALDVLERGLLEALAAVRGKRKA